jgi:hypothetical protein
VKKGIFVLLVLIFAGIVGYNILYNGFSDIKTITIQTYEEPFEQGKVTTDQEKIDEITGILNRADHISGVEYKIGGKPKYKILLTFADKRTETMDILENFDLDTTLLISDKGDYYKISQKNIKRIKTLLLK